LSLCGPAAAAAAAHVAAGSASSPRRRGLGLRAARCQSYVAPSVQLYQYEICPFCCKVKAFLDWQKMPYRTVEVNPLSKKELKFSEGYKKVPVALIEGQQVNDSTDILASLAAQSGQAGPALRAAMAEPETCRWLQWVDKELAVLIFPNATRTLGDSWEAFKYVREVPTFDVGTKMVSHAGGSVAMWIAHSKLKKKYNISDEKKQLMEAIQLWVDAVGDGPFLKGQALSLADVAVYGVVSSIRGLEAYTDLMAASPAFARWNDAVMQAIGPSMRVEDTPLVRHFGPTAVL